ncbi:hypothetical protein [Hoeflea sp. TYP-13]|uniref:hypothetical protein n=1 Tax=Hoeflea sp. TYP-13 TaxID=3230023 RepID=UPI0034C6CD90
MQDQVTTKQRSSITDTAAEIQAHLGQPSKFANGKTRNWSLFVFFRILSKSEIDSSRRLFAKVVAAAVSSGKTKKKLGEADDLAADLCSPQISVYEASETGGAPHQDALRELPPADPTRDHFASEEFRAWLKLLSKGDYSELAGKITEFFGAGGSQPTSPAVKKLAKALGAALAGKDGIFGAIELVQSNLARNPDDETGLVSLILAVAHLLKNPDPKLKKAVAGIFDLTAFGSEAGEAGEKVVAHRLVAVCTYELLRQFKLARDGAADRAGGTGHVAPVRTERAEGGRAADGAAVDEGAGPNGYDTVPINIAFTYPGLEKLNIDSGTLRSFPDVFRQGMAARAKRLGDTGPSAPENWDGELGLRSVHGYFTGGFQVGRFCDDGKWNLGPEEHWARLRRDIDDFNGRKGSRGKMLRLFLGGLFKLIGMEIVHIELGQDPYSIEDGMAVTSGFRKEHFGFRDGISQPFVDMKLGKPMRGGATPGRNGTWAPVAPGEIYLGFPDEDGNQASQPANKLLRDGGTFLVFRKLEQDVARFRTFLAEQRPDDAYAQQKLAAQFMGRWKDGTPLVMAPDNPGALGSEKDHLINDFLYVRDDPDGDKCPLSSHVRRSNPRDIGGRNSARRHRILRRSIGYGGPLLEENSPGDGNKRGLLFIAANARIDLQFEVVQADWMNGGEFLGQAGLDRCPIAGANSGRQEDRFYEAGAAAPVTGIPRFVTTRGGDYFFAPGKGALEGMAEQDRFELNEDDLLSAGHSMGDPQTPGLFTETRVKNIVRMFLPRKNDARLVRVKIPGIPETSPYNDGASLHEPEGLGDNMCFVGKYGHVSDVLRLLDENGKRRFSVTQYRQAGRRVTRGDDILIGTEISSDTEERRARLFTLLNAAWLTLDEALRHRDPAENIRTRLESIVAGRLNAAIERTGDSQRVDLVRDFASDASYAVISDLFGTPGPGWITELGISLPFARQHVGHLHPDWLAALKGKAPVNPGLATMQIWSILTLGDVFGNIISYKPLMNLSEQAGAEMINHLNRLISDAWTKRPSEITNLLDAFIHIEEDMLKQFNRYSRAEYHADVSAIFFELIASAMAAIPSTFGNIMDSLFRFRIDLPMLFDRFTRLGVQPYGGGGKYGPSLVTRLIYESERLSPNFKILMRRCVKSTELEPGVKIRKGEWVAALVAAANLDGAVFKDPYRFSLHPFVTDHPPRPMENYLLFGAVTHPKSGETDIETRVRGRHCWGRDAVALYILEQSVMAAARLDGLRRVAGQAGEVQDLAGATTGLWGRFSSVLPDWADK